MRYRWVVIFILVLLPFLHQNCAKVGLEKQPIEELLAFKTGVVSLCLKDDYAESTLESVMVLNLNLAIRGQALYIDSDADGLTDEEEEQFGFNYLNRRTGGRFLDKICLDVNGSSEDCQNNLITCSSSSVNAFGFSECDLRALGLDQLYGHPTQGVDSDKDGIADFIEVLRGTLPNESDGLSDPDHDLVTTNLEIQRGSNPFVYDEPFSSNYETKVRVTKLPASSACTQEQGEHWSVQIDHLPWAKTLSGYSDSSEIYLPSGGISVSRSAGTNVGAIILRLFPRVGAVGNVKFLVRPLLLSEDLINLDSTIDNFIFAGEVLQ